MPTRATLSFWFSLCLAVFLASCKGASESCDPTDPLCGGGTTRVPTTVTVNPPSLMFTAAGQTEQLTATVLDQNGNVMTTASVTWMSDDEGVATVSASGLVTAVGVGTATVEATSGTAMGSSAVMVEDPCVPRAMLTVGDSESSTLDSGDCVINDFITELYTLEVAAEDAGTIQIDAISSAFDSYVALFDDVGNLIAENDNAHSTGLSTYDQSAHVFESLAEGTYVIVVTSSGSGAMGDYYLYVGYGLPCPETGSMSVGQAVGGTLAIGDCQYGPGFYADVYVVEVTTAATYTITETSADIDSYLTLYDPAGNYVADNDDSPVGGTLDSQITIALLPGWYVVEASSFDPDEVGDYTLTFQ